MQRVQPKRTNEAILNELANHLVNSFKIVEGRSDKGFYYPHRAPNELKNKCGSDIDSILINSPYFEHIAPDFYRLKAGVSASKALIDLLFKGEHIIDCTMALQIAQYNAIRLTLNTFSTNNANGTKSFDALFGDVEGTVAEDCRLLFSIYPSHKNTFEKSEIGYFFAFSPLCLFLDFTKNAKTKNPKCDAAKLRKGLTAYVKGHPDYTKKHVGAGQGFNVIADGEGGFYSFGTGLIPVDESKLKDAAAFFYNQHPTLSSQQRQGYDIRLIGHQCTAKDIIGLQSDSIVEFLTRMINEALDDAYGLQLEMKSKLEKLNRPVREAITTYIDPYKKVVQENRELQKKLSAVGVMTANGFGGFASRREDENSNPRDPVLSESRIGGERRHPM